MEWTYAERRPGQSLQEFFAQHIDHEDEEKSFTLLALSHVMRGVCYGAYRYVNNDRSVASTYPANPNGSPFAIAALTNADGRVTITMPHPERSVRYVQNSWRPDGAEEWSGWMRLFRNARRFVG